MNHLKNDDFSNHHSILKNVIPSQSTKTYSWKISQQFKKKKKKIGKKYFWKKKNFRKKKKLKKKIE
jgi:hypothetical protein